MPFQPDRQKQFLAALKSPAPDLNHLRRSIVNGANVNGLNFVCSTPLMEMAATGHISGLRALLALGADVNAARDDGITALMFAAWNGKYAAAEILLQHGALANVQAANGETALFSLARWGSDLDMIRLLLSHGADASLACRQGRKAADCARDNRHFECMTLLQAAENRKNGAVLWQKQIQSRPKNRYRL